MVNKMYQQMTYRVFLVCVFSFAICPLTMSECPDCCRCEEVMSEIRLHCGCVQGIIPNDTTNFILDELGKSHAQIHLNHPSWTNVKSLDLKVESDRRGDSISRNSFLGVPHFEVLRLPNLYFMEHIPTGVFRHLHKLKILDLSNNFRLQLSGLSTIFPDLQNLSPESLNLSRTNMFSRGWKTTMLGMNFLRNFTKLPVKVIDISWVGRIFLDFQGITSYESISFSHLEVLDVSHTYIGVSYSNNFEKLGSRSELCLLVFPVLKHLTYRGFSYSFRHVADAQDCVMEPLSYSYHAYCASIPRHTVYFLPPFLESANVDYTSAVNMRCVEQRKAKMQCVNPNNQIKSLSIKHANITGWNLMVTLNSLRILDLRFNCIRVITAVSLRYIPKLKRLLLGSNQLWKYQRNASFEGVFHYCNMLQDIDLSRNNLSWIPKLLFQINSSLQVINLSGNRLTSISFEISHLSDLRIFDLSLNTISTLDDLSASTILTLAVNHESSFIDMRINQFICSCESVTFIKTLHDISSALIAYEEYDCSYNGHDTNLYLIDEAILRKDCILEILKVALPLVCAFVFICCMVLLVYIKRTYVVKMYITCRFWRYRKKLKNIQDRVFLAYSHHDKELVFTSIHHVLNSKLQRLLGTDDDVLYINDKHFALPGLIDEEIVTAVSSCKCTVALVSRRFLKSSWTHLEISYAWSIKRPIILVFLEDIQKKELHGLLGYLYNEDLRLFWPRSARKEDEEIFWTNLLGGLVKILDCNQKLPITQAEVDVQDDGDDTSQISTLL